MAILPVSSIKLDTNNIPSFRGDMEGEPKREPNRVSGVRKLATVPVVVLMTLNPSLSAQAAGNNAPEPKQITMEMPYAAPTHSQSAEPMYDFAAEAAALAEAPESAPTPQVCSDKNLPRAQRVQQDYDFESQLPYPQAKPLLVQKFSSDGHNYAIVYASGRTGLEYKIEDVYIFEKGEPLQELKRISAIGDHNIGPNEEFCGVLVTRRVYDKEKKEQGILEKEIRLPDEVAENLIKLLTNNLQWENNTLIDYVETNSNRLLPAKAKFID